MADMYGAVRSSWFKVNDPEAFKTWFEENVVLSDGADLVVEREMILDPTDYTKAPTCGDYQCAVMGTGMYPSAFPYKPGNKEEDPFADPEPWDLEEFATELRKHLAPGEQFKVLAAGNEKLRYVGAQYLLVTHEKAEFLDLYAGN